MPTQIVTAWKIDGQWMMDVRDVSHLSVTDQNNLGSRILAGVIDEQNKRQQPQGKE